MKNIAQKTHRIFVDKSDFFKSCSFSVFFQKKIKKNYKKSLYLNKKISIMV